MSHHQFEFRLGQTSLKWLPGKVKFFIPKFTKMKNLTSNIKTRDLLTVLFSDDVRSSRTALNGDSSWIICVQQPLAHAFFKHRLKIYLVLNSKTYRKVPKSTWTHGYFGQQRISVQESTVRSSSPYSKDLNFELV